MARHSSDQSGQSHKKSFFTIICSISKTQCIEHSRNRFERNMAEGYKNTLLIPQNDVNNVINNIKCCILLALSLRAIPTALT